nr:MAG TPA: hypothetical protein [Caudoviricetes sp.]DAM57747.1 MAG TPA: hypothetical protein [Caudoviricetes sp.]DAO34501.1 MAG TPA: hypothetical protein [Caudoviricetes sp.]DAS12626.1 MAG TPA: hypothetical protein [Caudoviricetes sp.]DAY26166.1 MAG TPA: hypothetical protein [Caudoviricetes sp.]
MCSFLPLVSLIKGSPESNLELGPNPSSKGANYG